MGRQPVMASDSQLQNLLKRDNTLVGGVVVGLDGHHIEIQARAVSVARTALTWSSATTISGMARGAVSEALDRITGAFAKLGFPGPRVEILINLAPADLPKEGTWLDLPMAVIMLQAAGVLPDLAAAGEGSYVLVGEVGLHGDVRRVPGVLSIAHIATPGQTLIVPAGNEKECALIMARPGFDGCQVCPVAGLDQVVDFFAGRRKLENALGSGIQFEPVIPKCIDFGRIKGQEAAKEAALVAAAGGHNLLMIGPPGEGKSLLASAIPGILPKLAEEEMVELTRIFSACGELERDGQAVTRRPFRQVHHTASKESLIGGGSGMARPGEITLAHLGVLFMDEIAEFNRGTLEALRQPLEDGHVNISRVGGSIEYPCRFTLVAAMNPCPCGDFGTDRCRCKETEVRKYQAKLSGPIVDRIDLQVELQRLTTEERFADDGQDISSRMRAAVDQARSRQAERFKGTGIACNAAIPGGRVREYCRFNPAAFERYKSIIDHETLTTRSVDRLAKVARTLADLQAVDEIDVPHIDKAAEFVVGGMLRSAV